MLAASVASLAIPALAQAAPHVRVFHAVPGAGAATLTVGDADGVGPARFGQASKLGAVAAGTDPWKLEVDGREIASGNAQLEDGRNYTAVVFADGGAPSVTFFPDARNVPGGKARLRAIHAAPDFGSPDLALDGSTVVRRFAFRRATPYLAVAPGPHSVAALRSGTTRKLLSIDATLKAGTATTAVVIGTQGEKTRVVALQDVAAKAPRPTNRSVASTRPRRTSSHTVRRGESLWSIARAALGTRASNAAVARRVEALWTQNREAIGTGDRNLIFPGTVLRLR